MMHGLKPVRIAKFPAYPTKANAFQNPHLLKELPDRWNKCKKAAIAAGLAASLSFTFSSCSVNTGAPLPYPIVSEEEAMQIIKSVSGTLFTNAVPLDVKNAKNTLIYMQYNLSDKTFEQITLTGGSKIIIDAFNETKGVGVEYLKMKALRIKKPPSLTPQAKLLNMRIKPVIILWLYKVPIRVMKKG